MGEILYPSGAGSSGDYRNTYKKLKDAGFTNVTAEGAGDLFFGILETENDIIEITVDGAPDFEKNTWYPSDTPIVIKYHSFSKETESTIKSGAQTVTQKAQDAVNSAVSSVQNKTSEIAASASSIISDTIDEVSSGDTTYSRSVSPSALSYDLCFVHRYSDYDAYYAIRKDDSTVRYFTTNDLSVMVSKRKTGSLRSAGGMVVSFPYNGGFEVSLRYTYADKDNTITVTAADGTATDFSLIGSAAVKRVLSSDDYFDWDSSQPKPESSITNRAAASSSSDAVSEAASKPEPSLDYTPAHQDTDYDSNAYVLPDTETNSKVYLLVSYKDKIIRVFIYGDGSPKDGYVGHITSGGKSDGFFVHFNYGNGSDWFIKPDGNRMVLIDQDLKNYIYTTVPSHPVRDIYKDANYKDLPEK